MRERIHSSIDETETLYEALVPPLREKYPDFFDERFTKEYFVWARPALLRLLDQTSIVPLTTVIRRLWLT